jgi:penicillin G amidase
MKINPRKTLTLILLLSLCVFSTSFGISLRSNAQAQLSSSEDPSLTVGLTPQQTPRTINVPGLENRVTVRRDERGIPYIEAANEADLYFAQGYVTANDRLWQMDLMRRTARGELAEVLTAGPKNVALEQDKQHRTMGFAQEVEAELAGASPQSRAILDAYARGVNAYIDSLDPKSMPPEIQILQYKPRPWTASDSLLPVKLFAEALSTTWRIDIMREALSALPAEKRAMLLPEVSPLDVLVVGKDTKKLNASLSNDNKFSDPISPGLIAAVEKDQEVAAQALEAIGLYAEGLAASNNWVVNGKHTLSGKPLLANDPHLAASVPSIWHLVNLSAPGLHVSGVTAPGLPGVVIGHNDRIAWGFTNVGPDVQDLYIEKFDPANPRRYQTPQGWRDAELRHEEIKVRKGYTSPETEVVPLDVTVTRHGPIILERDSKRYALRWTALDPKANRSDSTSLVSHARNWKEFTEALRSFTAPTQNIVYADVDGHIGYYAAGVIPIRKSGDGSVPYDGSTDDGEWTSYIPTDKLPHLFDPPSGIIVTANQRIVGTDYPYFLTHSWAQPYRARRIFNLLNEKSRLTTDDFRRIQGDVHSIALAAFAHDCAKLLKPGLAPGDQKLRETLTAFENWDGEVKAGSAEALLLFQMRAAFRSRILTAALGPDLFKLYGWANIEATLDRLIAEQPKEWLPKEFTGYADLIKACYDDARQNLTRNLGADESKWKWGEMFKVRFQHPMADVPFIGQQFAIPPFAQNGVGSLGATVNVGSNVSMRFIADPSDWDKTQHGITLGESGLPSSSHWKDQLDDWRNVTPRVFPFTRAAVESATRDLLILEPGRK